MAKEFTVLDDRGIVTIGANVGTAVADFFAWLYCNNGQIYSDDLRSVAFNSEVGMETLNWMVNFTNDINGGVQNASPTSSPVLVKPLRHSRGTTTAS
ncbi:MAG: hypothetical protein R2856_21055 [Caldilineaceae bacterium]